MHPEKSTDTGIWFIIYSLESGVANRTCQHRFPKPAAWPNMLDSCLEISGLGPQSLPMYSFPSAFPSDILAEL